MYASASIITEIKKPHCTETSQCGSQEWNRTPNATNLSIVSIFCRECEMHLQVLCRDFCLTRNGIVTLRSISPHTTGVVEHHACAGVYLRQILWISAFKFASRSLQDVHMRYVYTCVYTYVYVWMYIYIYVCISIRIYAYIYGCVYVCVCMYMCIYIYVYIYICVCICMCIYICIYLYIACMCSLFHSTLGNEDGGVQLVYESACCLAWGVIFDRRKDRGVVCVFSIFKAVGSVCVRVCVYTHTHTHTAQMEYLDLSPGVGMRHLEGPKNPDGLNLGIHIFVYV